MKITIPGGDYYLIAEAARVWGVDVSYVRRLCAQGRLPAIRIGRLAWIIHSYEVENRTEPTQHIPPRLSRRSRSRGRRRRNRRRAQPSRPLDEG